ncbi:uncharacterized protein B0I36DRAFT_349429 [Microdochium trichocladiopsis]|uniref:Uncharacterized protein n=1 Tax=Microdochium trichocladiopsis TaxID=1682393 RepID=A0A9P8Y527_9PEZI|nr:uncharacterized protein B0I36DRAFT_349429 [Microdochium trichocladiopsis]KAH7031342.1 hypothetical protein B0I36DRAFT_349429 [Microdochium trichocladiopsis]
MKYSVAVAVVIGATSVSAMPVTGPVAALRERGFFDSIGNYFTGGSTSTTPAAPVQSQPATTTNPVEDALNTIVGGGALSPQIIRLLQDGSLAQNTLATISKSDASVKVKGLLKDQQFLNKAGALFTNETFINELATATVSTHASAQAVDLIGNADYLGFLSGIVGDKDIFNAVAGALAGGNFNLGGFLSSSAQSQAVWNLAASLTGDASLAAKLEALFTDKVFIARFDALLNSKGDFAAVLTDILQDGEFIAHVCNILGLSPELTAKITALFSAGANFGASLEALLGADFAGQITGLIGTGSIGSLITGALSGLGSFNAIISGYLSSGTIVSAIGSLLGNVNFTGKFTALLQGFLSGNLDLNAIVGNITADMGFLTMITGALGIPLKIVQTVVAKITASGFFKVFFGFFNVGN